MALAKKISQSCVHPNPVVLPLEALVVLEMQAKQSFGHSAAPVANF